MVESWQATSVSLEEINQKQQSASSNDDNDMDNCITETETNISPPEKSMAWYFQINATIL